MKILLNSLNRLTINVPIINRMRLDAMRSDAMVYLFRHIETSQLICRANQLLGFYMMGTLVVKRLKLT